MRCQKRFREASQEVEGSSCPETELFVDEEAEEVDSSYATARVGPARVEPSRVAPVCTVVVARRSF